MKTAKDLEGGRIGLPMYTMTASIFIKGLLAHECGVDLSNVTWVEGQINGGDRHGNPVPMPLVKPVAIERNQSGKSLSDLLEGGKLHAVVGTSLPRALGRNPDIVRLYPDYHAAEKEYFLRTRIFPIMHLVAMRRDIYEKHPFVATSLYWALAAAKQHAMHKMRIQVSLRYMLPWLADHVAEIDQVFGGDAFPYGIEANRPTLNALVQYLHEQALIADPVKVDELFVPLDGGG